ncbi:MAG: hypothetical protein AMS24_04055 [Chlamydiae bacterium SM23_39]|nr:MAG: hypothetical protein AMS24_04055 [Chlamydiae bacterium SM23_39]
MTKIFFFLFFFFLSCNYKLGNEYFKSSSINVPYIQGDKDGILTKELVFELAETGVFEYKNNSADFNLNISILNTFDEQIGYRFDRDNKGKRKKNIMATEGRKKIKAKISLFSKKEKKIIFGPKIIETDVDYDYVTQDSINDLSFILPNGKRETVLQFSLGQLESISAAQKATLLPLYKSLAKKIVKIILSEVNNS